MMLRKIYLHMLLESVICTLFLFLSRVIAKVEDQVGFSCTNISGKEGYGCNERSGKLRVFIVADAGGREYTENLMMPRHGPTVGQRSVAALMGQLASQQQKGPNLVLNLGDNFYEKGVTVKDVDERFKRNFLDVFGKVGSATVPWYTVAGNRDYGSGDITPQIEKTRGKWTFPAPYYTVHYNFGINLDIRVRFVMIDTVILCGPNRKMFKNKEEFTSEMEKASNEHFEWLDNELKLANKKGVHFLFVAGHYPLYVTAGDRSFSCAKRFQQLLHKHHVSAYFSGHEHNLKHVVMENGVQVIVAGAGSRMESAFKETHVPKQYMKLLRFGYPNSIQIRDDKGTIVSDEYVGGGFVAMEIDENAMEAKINFYAAGNIYPTSNKFLHYVNSREFEHTVKLKSRQVNS